MPKKTVHCSICGKAISGVDFGERMKKLRRHRKKHHPTAHKRSTKKTLKTKREKGLINKKRRKRTHDPAIKARRQLIETPKVISYADLKADGLIRVLIRQDQTAFPEFAFYTRARKDLEVALSDAGLKQESRGKWVLRTNKFNIFVYL